MLERTREARLSLFLDRLDRAEIAWVRRQNALTHHPRIRRAAEVISTAGNGWIYVAVATAVVLADLTTGITVILTAGVSTAVAHSIYPFVKTAIARPRPYARWINVQSIGRPLDLYSFPSGHCMTAAIVLIVTGTAFPLAIPLGVAAIALLAWARVACAHHYPSDLVCGLALGWAVAFPIAHLVVR